MLYCFNIVCPKKTSVKFDEVLKCVYLRFECVSGSKIGIITTLTRSCTSESLENIFIFAQCQHPCLGDCLALGDGKPRGREHLTWEFNAGTTRPGLGKYTALFRRGYPWATLNTNQQQQFPKLRKPGWLPTAVVANLVSVATERPGKKANPRDLITIEGSGNDLVYLNLPDGSQESSWVPDEDSIEPIEIIDGQHRLYAFSEDEKLDGSFELPVVLFEDLDISWQAYLFWSINVTPKRINPSLAYDLYPLLRTTDWARASRRANDISGDSCTGIDRGPLEPS